MHAAANRKARHPVNYPNLAPGPAGAAFTARKVSGLYTKILHHPGLLLANRAVNATEKARLGNDFLTGVTPRQRFAEGESHQGGRCLSSGQSASPVRWMISFQVENSISMITSAKPMRKLISWARGLTGFPNSASSA